MGDNVRPVNDEMTQEEQSAQLSETVNEPTVPDETVLIEALFGTQELGEQ